MRADAARSAATLLFLLFPVGCSNGAPGDRVDESLAGGISGTGMLSYLEAKVDIARDKFVDLAEAIPEDSYDWRPMEGVRSFREIFVHIAADNWYGGALMGIPRPDDIPVSEEGETVRAYQEQRLSKAETLVHLNRSFDYLSDALDQTRDRLDQPAMLRTTQLTYGDLWVRLITHMHEHLGQSVAYARANEIVPPWSR